MKEKWADGKFGSGDDIRRQAVRNRDQAILELQFALFKPLHLQLIEGAEGFQRQNGGIEITVFDVQAMQFRLQRLLFFIAQIRPHLLPRSNFAVFPPTCDFAGFNATGSFVGCVLTRRSRIYPQADECQMQRHFVACEAAKICNTPFPDIRNGGFIMSLIAHLAELERKHSVLDKKLADELAHPHQDETRIAALKRQKLVLKDEISRLKATPKPPNASLH